MWHRSSESSSFRLIYVGFRFPMSFLKMNISGKQTHTVKLLLQSVQHIQILQWKISEC